MTVSCVLILVQLNKCVVCGSDLQMRHSSDGCLSATILFKYECWMRHLFVLSWAFVQRVALECCICVIYFEWHDKLVVFWLLRYLFVNDRSKWRRYVNVMKRKSNPIGKRTINR